MTTNIVRLSYASTHLDAVQMGGQMWLRGSQICHPLGLSDYRSVLRIFDKNSDEFTSNETRVVPLPTEGGVQNTRVFSLRGAHLLGLIARTPEAKKFRRWVLDVLEGKVGRQPVQQALNLPGTHPLARETLLVVEEIIPLLEEGSEARARMVELRDGMRPVASDPFLDLLVQQFDAARALHGEANRAYRAVARQAKRAGFTMDGVKAAARQTRSAAA